MQQTKLKTNTMEHNVPINTGFEKINKRKERKDDKKKNPNQNLSVSTVSNLWDIDNPES